VVKHDCFATTTSLTTFGYSFAMANKYGIVICNKMTMKNCSTVFG